MIAAPKTKLNTPEFISIQTHKAIYLCASHDTAHNAKESPIVILISVYSALNAASPLLHRAQDPQGGTGWRQSLVCAVRSGLAENTAQGAPWVKFQPEEPQRGSQTFHFPSLTDEDTAAAHTDNRLQNYTVPTAKQKCRSWSTFSSRQQHPMTG